MLSAYAWAALVSSPTLPLSPNKERQVEVEGQKQANVWIETASVICSLRCSKSMWNVCMTQTYCTACICCSLFTLIADSICQASGLPHTCDSSHRLCTHALSNGLHALVLYCLPLFIIWSWPTQVLFNFLILFGGVLWLLHDISAVGASGGCPSGAFPFSCALFSLLIFLTTLLG